MRARPVIPKIIWSLWFQGWEEAPRIARASAHSWSALNPDWHIHKLDRRTLLDFLPELELTNLAPDAYPAAQSDQIRIALLQRYGGVWADATTLCVKPLNDWLPAAAASGFFAFDKPGEDRMLASWFLAAEKGAYIIGKWRDLVVDYWKVHHEPDDYFWFHKLFASAVQADEIFREAWREVPKVSAQHPGHFGPNDARLLAVSNDLEIVVNPPAPVLKLTHKLPTAPHSARLIDGLCDWAEGLPQANAHSKKRILVTWYGSFPGHGTVGDLLALEALVTHLVGRGHDVSHATGDAISITGSNCVRWDLAWPEDFDAVLFVCGPILNFHPLTNSLFERFSRSRLAGIGVSMMPEGHPYHSNPFQFVLAREGLSDRFGDLAILAPRPTSLGAVHRPKIGISLRGPQNEYGEHRCRWLETDELALKLARTAAARIDAEIITIENHLARSGRSASAIETQYSECNLVITSRFHGAISALRAEVPFIAIDQIEGGAKLMSLLSPLPWPHTYSIDRLDADQLRNVSIQLVEQPHDPLLFATRQLCIRTANETLATLDDWLCSLV